MKLRLILATCVLALAAGCATPPPGTVKGFNDYAADILQATDAAMGLAKTLYAAGKLNDAEAQAFIDTANTVVMGVQSAKSTAVASGEAAGTARLRLAADALDRLNAVIAAKKGK